MVTRVEAYLDNAATTKAAKEVVEIVSKAMLEDYGNPSSKHTKGVEAEKYIKQALEIISKTLKCHQKEIVFTSGGTESNNMAIIGAAMANKRSGNQVIVSSVEHSSVKAPFRYLEKQGFQVDYIPVLKDGTIDMESFKNMLSDDTILVSVMMVNNEIGTIEPIEEIGNMIKKFNKNILFHVYSIQAYGKMKIVPKKYNIDLMSVSGHKLHGPKGVGFLYIKEKTKINPIITGGGQQNRMRSGTENVPGIAGLGKAAELIYTSDFNKKIEYLYDLRAYFIEKLKMFDEVYINGVCDSEADDEKEHAISHIVSASFKGIKAEVLLHALEEKKIYVSSGSACSSNNPGVSSTLMAVGVDKELLDSTLRFSFCFDTTKEQLDYTIQALEELLPVLRKYKNY